MYERLPQHPTLLHPRTGLPLEAIGTVNGRPIWPIMGGSGDDQQDQQGGIDGGQTGSDQGGANQQGQTGGQQQDEPQDVASLPAWAQKLIKDTRTDAASNRARANQLEKASQAQLDAIAQAAGLKPADADPAKLAEELAKTQAKARDSAVHLAVYRTAGKHQADPDALLDSRSFLTAVAELDPSAADFAAKVETAVKDAVKTNPKLKAQAAVSRSGGDGPPGGSGNAKQRPAGLGAAITAHYKT